MHTLAAGLHTSYFEAGDGEPIVALHGIPTSSALFRPLIPHLTEFRLVAPDLLGQGHTEAPRRGRLDFAAYSRHLEGFLDAVPPPTFHLLIHDFGAVLGLNWATAHASRVRSIVVLSTTVSFSLRIWSLYVLNLTLGREGLRRLMPLTLKRTRTVAPDVLRDWASPWTRRRLLRGMDHFSARRLRALRERLVHFAVPTLVLWGEDDNIFPVVRGEALARVMPNATFVAIPNCGHWTPLDAPEDVAERVRIFFHSQISQVS